MVAGEDAELSYSAYDAEGKAVTDFEVLNRIKFTGGSGKGLRFEKKAGKAVLMYMPAAKKDIKEAQQEYVTYITPTNNFGSAMLTVNPARHPAKIAGLKKDTATSVTVAKSGAKFTIPVNKVDVKDQYGDDFDVTKLPVGFALKVSFNDDAKNIFKTYGAQNGATTYSAVVSYGAVAATTKNYDKYDIVSASAVTPGATKVNLELLDENGKTMEGSAYTINIVTVPTSDVKDVMIEDIPLKEASSGSTITYATPVAIGTVDGKRVALVEGRDYEIVSGTTEVPDKNTLKNGATEGKATVSIIVMDGKGTRVNKEYTYSNKERVVASAEVANDGTAKVATASGVVTVGGVLAALEIKDQYGNPAASQLGKAYVTFSNLPYRTENDKILVDKNGGSDAQLSNVRAGDVVTVRISFAGSTYVFEKELTIKD